MLYNSVNVKYYSSREHNMAITLDHIDKAILRELQEDASISNFDLSKKIGLSPSACLARTKNLVEGGVIQKIAAIVDEKKLGMEILAFALVNLTPLNRETIHSFLEEVKKLPQVQECYTLTGSHDYLLKIVAKDMASYRDFIIDSLMQNTAISRVETSMVMGIEKRTVNVPIDED
jgi:Lrp/AsnC family leucine-responsive transcriptional regulator